MIKDKASLIDIKMSGQPSGTFIYLTAIYQGSTKCQTIVSKYGRTLSLGELTDKAYYSFQELQNASLV